MAIKIEIIGVEPACKRCKQTMENAFKAVEKLRAEDVDVEVEKLDVMERKPWTGSAWYAPPPWPSTA